MIISKYLCKISSFLWFVFHRCTHIHRFHIILFTLFHQAWIPAKHLNWYRIISSTIVWILKNLSLFKINVHKLVGLKYLISSNLYFRPRFGFCNHGNIVLFPRFLRTFEVWSRITLRLHFSHSVSSTMNIFHSKTFFSGQHFLTFSTLTLCKQNFLKIPFLFLFKMHKFYLEWVCFLKIGNTTSHIRHITFRSCLKIIILSSKLIVIRVTLDLE